MRILERYSAWVGEMEGWREEDGWDEILREGSSEEGGIVPAGVLVIVVVVVAVVVIDG